MKLSQIKASKVYDSRGKATIEVTINFNSTSVSASAPNGTSRGKKEVIDFSRKGVDYSIELVNKVGAEILSKGLKFESFEDLAKIEEIIRKYDSSSDYRIFGGNAVYALEAAMLKAIAKANELETWQLLESKAKAKPKMPLPLGNCIGGGKHIKESEKPEFQEFLLTPRTKKFFEAVFINREAYKRAKEFLQKKGKLTGLTIENALFGPFSNEEALSILEEVRESIKESFGIKLELGVDIAATSFYSKSKNAYYYSKPARPAQPAQPVELTKPAKSIRPAILSASAQLDYISELIKKHGLFYVEDPFHEDDFESFSRLSAITKCLIVGDDLTCTNAEIIKKAIACKAIKGVIIKPNQAGSLIATKQAFDLARRAGLKTIISHRSGETEDDFIADLAVGWQADFIKAGIIGKEREAKLKRVVAIEKSLTGE